MRLVLIGLVHLYADYNGILLLVGLQGDTSRGLWFRVRFWSLGNHTELMAHGLLVFAPEASTQTRPFMLILSTASHAETIETDTEAKHPQQIKLPASMHHRLQLPRSNILRHNKRITKPSTSKCRARHKPVEPTP